MDMARARVRAWPVTPNPSRLPILSHAIDMGWLPPKVVAMG